MRRRRQRDRIRPCGAATRLAWTADDRFSQSGETKAGELERVRALAFVEQAHTELMRHLVACEPLVARPRPSGSADHSRARGRAPFGWNDGRGEQRSPRT